jgi:hypothetical protein
MITIHSNGSKWYGQEPDTIDKLIEVLTSCTIEERFFTSYKHNLEHGHEYRNLCPISEENGMTMFFGNFEEVSHVFRIETDEPEVIEKLSAAIKANKGWDLYYNKNLV